jgi:hypothetical protein
MIMIMIIIMIWYDNDMIWYDNDNNDNNDNNVIW